MPIPYPQDQTDRYAVDSQNEQAQASIGATYGARAISTLQDTFTDDIIGAVKNRDGSQVLDPKEATEQYGNGGLTHFDAPVTKDYAQWKSGQDVQKNAIADTMARGGSASSQNTWLGFGLSNAVGLLDAPSDAVAIGTDGLTKFNAIAKPLGDIAAQSAIAGRVASGVTKATLFSGVTEPLHYALDDNYNINDAAARLGSGALFLGLTEGLFGHTPLKFFSEDKDIPTPEQQVTQNLLEDHLQPETKVAMAQASASRATNGKSYDPINDIIGLDPRIVEHEAKLGGVELPMDERADLLASMDEGTYKEPSEVAQLEKPENKVTLQLPDYASGSRDSILDQEPKNQYSWKEPNPETGVIPAPDLVKEATPEDRVSFLRQAGDALGLNLNRFSSLQMMRSKIEIAENQLRAQKQAPVSLAEGRQGFLDRNAEVQGTPVTPHELTVRRLTTLRQNLQEEETQTPPHVNVVTTPNDLTSQENHLNMLLQPYETGRQLNESRIAPERTTEEAPTIAPGIEPNPEPNGESREGDAGGNTNGSIATREAEGMEGKELSVETDSKSDKIFKELMGVGKPISNGYRAFLQYYIEDAARRLYTLPLPELEKELAMQYAEKAIKGKTIADLVKGKVTLLTADNDTEGVTADLRKELLLEHGAEETDIHKIDDLPEEVENPLIDLSGEANNHFDLEPHQKELVSQPVDKITNKLDEAQSSEGHQPTRSLEELGIHGHITSDTLDHFDSLWGKDNWILKPWHPDFALQGSGIYYPEQLRAAFDGREAFHNRGYAMDDSTEVPITREDVQRAVRPDLYKVQKRVWVKGENPDMRRLGHSIIGNEMRVHLWADMKGNVHVVKGATVSKTAAGRAGVFHLWDTEKVRKAEDEAKKTAEGYPLAERTGSTFGFDMMEGQDDEWHTAESNPTTISQQVDQRTGRANDNNYSSGYRDAPQAQLAHLYALRGKIAPYVEKLRDLAKALIEEEKARTEIGQTGEAITPSERIDEEEKEKQPGYDQAVSCVSATV